MQEPSILAETVEIPVSEFNHVFKDTIELYNQLIALCKDVGILRGSELARLTANHQRALQAEKSPVARLLLVNAFIRQLITRIKKALPGLSPSKREVVCRAVTKIQLRAEALISHIRVLAEGKDKVSLNSGQARNYLAGKEGKPPSRRDTIRALRRAERICPALLCGHTPNDGRQPMRLTARSDDLQAAEATTEGLDRTTWQRSMMKEAGMIFFKEGVF